MKKKRKQRLSLPPRSSDSIKTKKETERQTKKGLSGRGRASFFSNPSCRFLTIVTLLFGLVFLLYLSSLRNEFTNWDDQMIYDNPSIRSLHWKNIIEIFTPKKASTYQPIRTLSYAVDYRFWELNPLGYHLTNIFFYFLTCVTVFFSTHLLLKNILAWIPSIESYRIAFFASFLFAAHPVHVEAVTWLTARKEVLQGFFFFLSFFLYMRSGEVQERKRKLIYVGSILLTFLLSVLSKPSAVVLPAIFLLCEVTRRGGEIRHFIRENRFFVMVAIVISLFFIFLLLKAMVQAGQIKPFYGGTMSSNLIIAFYLLLYNIRLLAFNTAYAAAYTITASFSIVSMRTLVVIAITMFLFLIGFWTKKRTNLFFFSFFWFFITLLPFLNIIPISTLLADRYAFLPCFAYCLILGFYLNQLYNLQIRSISSGLFKGVAVLLFISLLSGYSYMTIRQNRVWKNSFTLWADAVKKYPLSNLGNAMMGLVYMEQGEYEEAVKYLEKAVKIRPTDGLSRNNLGIAYTKLNKPGRALEEFIESIRLEPNDDNIQLNLSIFYLRQKEYGKSEEVLRNLLMRNPNNASLHFQMGRLYKDWGRIHEAVAEFEKSTRLAPGLIDAYEEIGNIYLGAFGDPEKAIHCYSQAIKLAGKPNSKTDDLRWIIQDLEGHR